MEKWIYLNVLKLGECDEEEEEEEEEDGMRMVKEASNVWYVIKPKAEGENGEVEIRRVFEEAEPFNHPNPALVRTNCEAMGSFIYVMGGGCVACHPSPNPACPFKDSNIIRCIDTQNPHLGWQTCFSLPIQGTLGRSAVVDHKWLLLFTSARHHHGVDPNYPCFAFVVTAGKPFKSSIHLPQPCVDGHVPFISSCISPGILASYMDAHAAIYTLDFNNINNSGDGNKLNCNWSVHDLNVPYCSKELYYFYHAVGDGIFYLCDYFQQKLISYDMRHKRQRYVLTLPQSFWIAFRGAATKIIVLSEDNLCLVSNLFDEPHSLRVYFTPFSVRYHSPQSQSQPYVDVLETQCFSIAGRRIENYVALDAPADMAKSRVGMASGVKADVLKEL